MRDPRNWPNENLRAPLLPTDLPREMVPQSDVDVDRLLCRMDDIILFRQPLRMHANRQCVSPRTRNSVQR